MSAFRFTWSEQLDDADRASMVRLLNDVAVSSGTNGFDRPLTRAQQDKLCASINFGLSAGSVEQLLVREAAGNEIVGIATLEMASQPTRCHIVEIKRVIIRREKRGLLMVRAWQEILLKCESRKWELVCIDVSEDGPHALWRKLGFVEYARVEDYARTEGRKQMGYFLSVYVAEAKRKTQALGRASAA